MFILKATKSDFKGSYDKLNLTLVVISSEIYETRRRLVSFSYKITTRVRSSMYAIVMINLSGNIRKVKRDLKPVHPLAGIVYVQRFYVYT